MAGVDDVTKHACEVAGFVSGLRHAAKIAIGDIGDRPKDHDGVLLSEFDQGFVLACTVIEAKLFEAISKIEAGEPLPPTP